jgi:LuxR family transcriptional regulator, maltose regulon positive regulatory protein
MSGYSYLVAAKLSRPRTLGVALVRNRLHDLLQASLMCPLTMISAPAGYGKTTLVSLWLNTVACPSAWLTLDEYDDDLFTFAAYLCAAIAAVVPGFGRHTKNVLESPTQLGAQQLADVFLHELQAVDNGMVVVIDDYHVLSQPEIHSFMERVLLHLPATVHVVLTTRADPPLRLTRMRLRGQLVEIRGAQLQFTLPEAADLLRTLIGAPAPPEVAQLLVERTEGWPVGLQLAAITLREHEDFAAFSNAFVRSTNQLVSEYLLQEVLDDLPPDEYLFLLRCSVLERFCASLCDALVAGMSQHLPTQQLLATLWQRNMFLIALDGEGRWYRFHPLFRELLQRQLRLALSAQEIATLHDRAGAWFEAHELVVDAILQSLQAGNDLSAARLVEHNLHAALNREEWRSVERWLNLLPDHVKRRPGLLLAQAWLEHFRYRFAAIPPLVDLAEQLLSDESLYTPAARTAMIGNITTLRAIAAFGFGPPADILHGTARALELLPPEQVFVRGIVEHYHLRSLARSGDAAGAIRSAYALLDKAPAQHDAYSLRLLLALCAIFFDQAELTALASTASVYRETAHHAGQELSVAWAQVCLGWVHYQRNELGLARELFASVVPAPFPAHTQAVLEGYTGLALTLCAQGSQAEAHAACESLSAYLTHHGLLNLLPVAEALAIRLELASGLLPSHRKLAGGETPALVGADLWIMPALVQAQAWLAAGSPHDLPLAAELLSQCRTFAAARNNRRRLIEIDALDALRCAVLGHQEEALALLARSVANAEAGGALRIFLDLGPGLQPLLQELLARHVAPAFIGRILAGYVVSPPPHPMLVDKASPPRPAASSVSAGSLLTNREVDVLILLAERLTDKEIAARLIISPRTVKRHTRNIYEKLYVNSRRAAVSQARTLGILPAP